MGAAKPTETSDPNGGQPSVGDEINPRKTLWKPKSGGLFVPRALAEYAGLSAIKKLCLAHLAWRHGEHGPCFPAQKDIAAGLGITDKKYVARLLQELEDEGFIKMKPRYDGTGRRTTSEYVFLHHKIYESDDGVQGSTDPLPQGSTDPGPGVNRPPTYGVNRPPREVITKNHHHQEQRGKNKSVERYSPPSAVQAESEPKKTSDSLLKVDDDEKPPVTYASSLDELKAIFQQKAGYPIPLEVLNFIETHLSLLLVPVPMSDFVAEVRKHAANRWRNPAGFLVDFAQKFRTKTTPASEPEIVPYKCPKCHSLKPGEGVLFEAGEIVPCECATPEYVERQIARGTLRRKESAA